MTFAATLKAVTTRRPFGHRVRTPATDREVTHDRIAPNSDPLDSALRPRLDVELLAHSWLRLLGR